RCAGNSSRADSPRLRHAHGHPAVLERTRRVVPLVLEHQVRDADPCGDPVPGEQWRVPLGVRDDMLACVRQHELVVAPHPGRVRRPAGAPTGEYRAKVRAALGRCRMHNLEETAARYALRRRVRVGIETAAARASLLALGAYYKGRHGSASTRAPT